jgi:PAS domain S-box-containing protein
LETVVSYDSAAIFLIEGDHVRAAAGRGVPDWETAGKVSFASEEDALLQEMKGTQRPLLLPDARKDRRFHALGGTDYVRGWLGVPLVAGGELIGCLTLDSKHVNHFNQTDAELVAVFARHAALAIENARLLRETREQTNELQRKAQQLNLVNQIAASINSALNLDQILKTAITEMTKVFKVEGGGVVIFDREMGYGEVVAEYREIEDPTAEKVRIPLHGNPSMEWISTHKRPLAIEDAQNYPWPVDLKRVFELSRIKSTLLVPLLVKGEVFGTIGLDALDTPRVFTEEEIELAQTIANQVALAIENAQLFEQTRHRALTLEELHKISLEITRCQQLPGLVKSILERAVKLLQATGGGLYLLDESGERIKLAEVWDLPEKHVGTAMEVGDGIVGQVIKTKAPFSVADYRNWKHRLRQYDEYNFTAAAGAPIIWQDRIWGAIGVHSDVQGETFSQEDLELLSHLGNLAAVVLENARRMNKLERLTASAFDAIIAVDEAGKVVEFNQQAEKILGYRADEVLEESVVPLYFDKEEPRRIKRKMLGESVDGRITDYDTFVKSIDGEKIPIRLSASLLFDYERKRAGSVGFFRDLRDIESARRQIKQLTGLLDAGRAITELRDPRAVLETIADKALETLHADVVSLYTYDHERDEIHVPPVSRGLQHVDAATSDVGPGSIVKKVIKDGKVRFADDAQTDLLVRGDFVDREGIRSCATCPLTVRDVIVGVMFCNYREPHRFTHEEQAVIRLFANVAAIAIENARRYMEEETMAWAGLLSSAWAHKVRGPASIVWTDAANLRHLVFDGLSSTKFSVLTEILDRMERNVRLVMDGVPALPAKDIEDVVEISAILDEIRKEIPNHVRVIRRRTKLPPVVANRGWISFVFRELVSNAVREMPEGGCITFTSLVREKDLLIEVADTGPGVAEPIRKQLFKVPRVEGAREDGFGLYLVKRALTRYGGGIELTKWESGTTFAVRLLLAHPHLSPKR